ncbi:alpha/beta fold hydrolase [Paraburkholderia sp.]|uniref:alpha/beta fold hydrolase n=1 Tax=Paraburkholderia sp. TaxID=1926495 RepID=UPI003D6F62CC
MSFSSPSAISDIDLVATLPGFKNAYAEVNGIRLHYVEGGIGEPLILLPSWPQTWWEFSRVLPQLAERYRVLAIDFRGMGGSDKPDGGYDKKTMASDIRALVSQLGLGTVNIAGNDVGSMVAYSFAANYPEATRKLVMMDSPHPFPVFEQIPLLPAPGTYDLDNPARAVHPWWFAFNQIPGLSERVFAGRYDIVQDWLYDYLAADKTKITAHDRVVYAAAYDNADALRAANGWFSAFATDIADAARYSPLTIPVLGLGGISYDFLAAFLGTTAPGATVLKLPNIGHWLPDEQPDEIVRLLTEFLE